MRMNPGTPARQSFKEVLDQGRGTVVSTAFSIFSGDTCWSKYHTVNSNATWKRQTGLPLLLYDYTVEPLSNDHPHQRPSLLYDHILCDGQCFLFVRSLTKDHT